MVGCSHHLLAVSRPVVFAPLSRKKTTILWPISVLDGLKGPQLILFPHPNTLSRRFFFHQALRPTAAYFVATLIFLLAVQARFALRNVLPEFGFPFLTFFPAVLLVSFITSFGPSLWCAILSTGAAWFYFMPPVGAFIPLASKDLFALVFFAAILIIDCYVISRMKTALRRMKLAESQLLAADVKKDEFLAVMAHELRNPLQIIRLTSKLLEKSVEGPARERIAILEKQGKQMERLVDDLMDTARIRNGKIHVELRPVDIRSILNSAIEAFKLIAKLKDQTIEWDDPIKEVIIQGDESRLIQVIENLLSNASKFSPRGRAIAVRLRVIRQEVNLSVIDEGNGFKPHLSEKIFGLYAQADESDTARGGLGIGLALARSIVERHDGHINAYSPGPGLGAVFTIKLPVAQPFTQPH
ncbi:MAG: HAMP domain-containing histidine kinase [Proteobacteria bacterium]|nr:MAG: HAMP domain-containing histidine kinase [Pseudomonadota bacterium]